MALQVNGSLGGNRSPAAPMELQKRRKLCVARPQCDSCAETYRHSHCSEGQCRGRIVRNGEEKRHRLRHHRSCPLCGFVASTRELNIHLRENRCTPIEVLPGIRPVFERLAMEPLGLSTPVWNHVEKFKNLRLHPFEAGPRIVEGPWPCLTTPTLLDVLLRLNQALGKSRWAKVSLGIDGISAPLTDRFKGEFWLRGECLTPSRQNLIPWIRNVIARDGLARDGKLINYPLPFHNREWPDFVDYLGHLAQEVASVSTEKIAIDAPECVITAKHSLTEIHHDALPHISTVQTLQASSDPAKLWIFWPPDQSNKLVYNGEYGHTNHIIPRLSAGRFAVQRAGETIFVPGGWPHMVYSLDFTLLVGSNIRTVQSDYLSSLQSEIFAGERADIALKGLLHHLQTALDTPYSIHQERVSDSLLTNLQRDHVYLRNDRGKWNKDLINILVEHRQRTGTCILCMVRGGKFENHVNEDLRDHIVGFHFENGTKKSLAQ